MFVAMDLLDGNHNKQRGTLMGKALEFWDRVTSDGRTGTTTFK